MKSSKYIKTWRKQGLKLGGYQVILADPPWSYTNWKGKDSGAAKAHYQCLSVEEISAMPVGALAADDCALLMWATFPKLPEALQVMNAWGFKFITSPFVWVKTYKTGNPYMGLGFWTRSGAELVIMGKRGSPSRGATNVLQVVDGMAPELGTVCDECMGAGTLPVRGKEKRVKCRDCDGVGTLDCEPVFKAERTAAHSVKPKNVQQRIEKLWTGPYVELFAREQRRGWDAWGDELE